MEIWPKEKKTVWMGYFACSADFPNGETRVILVSQYGGFFYDIKNKQYYSVGDEVREDWTEYFVDKRVDLYNRAGVKGTGPTFPIDSSKIKSSHN